MLLHLQITLRYIWHCTKHLDLETAVAFILLSSEWNPHTNLSHFGEEEPKEGPGDKVGDLEPADDGEAGEEPHGASDQTDLAVQLHLDSVTMSLFFYCIYRSFDK